jgi:TPR repeat protein
MKALSTLLICCLALTLVACGKPDWLKEAEAGDPEAQYYAGFNYATGRYVSLDLEEAVKWYRRAAQQGHVEAQHNLGYRYATGKGVVKNDVEAYAWYSLNPSFFHPDSRQVFEDVVSRLSLNDKELAQERLKELRATIPRSN